MRYLQVFSIFAALFLFSCNGNSQSHNTANNAVEQPEGAAPKGVVNIDQQQFVALQQKQSGLAIIDVRSAEEVAEGYIKGAGKFIDVNGANFVEQINTLDKNKPCVVYCRSGRRSAMAAQIMLQNGFTTVYNLEGGILSWTGEIQK